MYLCVSVPFSNADLHARRACKRGYLCAYGVYMYVNLYASEMRNI